MFDKLIFTLADIRLIRKVSVNIDDFDLYAQEVQRNFLQKLLGDKLYTALQADLDANNAPQEDRFADLINGEIYTDGHDIIYRGLKLYCSYVWLYLYINEASTQITPLGAMMFKDEQAESAEGKQSFRNARDHYIRAADGLEEPILRYLRHKENLFPEFSESAQIETAEKSNFAFKVIGQRIIPPNEFLM